MDPDQVHVDMKDTVPDSVHIAERKHSLIELDITRWIPSEPFRDQRRLCAS